MKTTRLETERLILRKFTDDDIEDIYNIFKDPLVNKYLPWFPLKDIRKQDYFIKNNTKRYIKIIRPTNMLSV